MSSHTDIPFICYYTPLSEPIIRAHSRLVSLMLPRQYAQCHSCNLIHYNRAAKMPWLRRQSRRDLHRAQTSWPTTIFRKRCASCL